MALNNLGLGFLFTARDLASGVMRRVRGSFHATSQAATTGFMNMDNAAKAGAAGVAVFGAGIATLAGGFAAANQFGAFEQKMAAVGAVTKASTQDLGALKDAAIDAGLATQFSPTEATEGLLSLATAGQTATQATRTLIPVLDLAAGSLGQLGVAQSAEAVVGTLNAYGKSADQAADVTDRLLRITQLTNFQTKDFEAGLSKAAAAGATFDQGLNDVLITMGLLRNRNIDASSSATAFRESTRRLGSDQRAQQAITDQGVEIFDKQTGKMRSIVDITMDLAEATKGLGDEERNATIVRGFGARGLLAFNAIQKAAFTTQKDGKTITLEGRDAIAALRKEMEQTKGTAQQFREALLDTFEGQKTLIKGSLETLAVVAGEGFAVTFKPIISGLITGINLLIQVIKNTPTPVKRFIAGAIMLAGVFLTVVGGVLLFKAGLALLLPVMAVVKATFISVALAFAPLIALAGLAALAFYAFKIALEDTAGGIGGAASRMFQPIKLAFEGITQLMTQGGFSGAVREEMNKAENQGIRNFAINVGVFFTRVKNFFAGMVAGFRETIKDSKGTFDSFFALLGVLGDTIGELFGVKSDPTENGKKWERWGQIGKKVGNIVAAGAVLMVRGLSLAVRATIWVVENFQTLWAITKVVGGAFLAFKLVTMAMTFGLFIMNAAMHSSRLAMLAYRLAVLAARSVTLLFRGTMMLLSGTVAIVKGGMALLAGGFAVMKGAALSAIPAIWSMIIPFLPLIAAIGAVTAAIALLISQWKQLEAVLGGSGKIGETFSRMIESGDISLSGFAKANDDILNEEARARAKEGNQKGKGQQPGSPGPGNVKDFFGGDQKIPATPGDLAAASPAVAEQQARAAIGGNQNIEEQLRMMNQQLGDLGARPVNVKSFLNVDGKVLAQATAESQRSDNATGFSPGAGPQE